MDNAIFSSTAIGMILLNIVAFSIANYASHISSWLNILMVIIEIMCLFLYLFSQKKKYKSIILALIILVNIFLVYLMALNIIDYKANV